LSGALLDHLVEAVPRPADIGEGAYRRTLRARAFDIARSLLPLATHTSVGQIVSARILEQQIGRLLSSSYAELRNVGEGLRAACQAPPEAPLTVDPPPPAAPTLVKYAAASPFAAQWSQDLGQIADELLAVLGDPDRASLVELAEPFSDPLRE